ncbi:hypothetical protein AE02_02810 [Klebsiella variicola]|nr:hypothetical protein [Klebsiella variicola]KDM26442.1 hypothetical protein AE02_02810 [Klebsiella variicola]
MKSVIPRAVLLVAPVIETLQRQLAEHFPLLRLYEVMKITRNRVTKRGYFKRDAAGKSR